MILQTKANPISGHFSRPHAQDKIAFSAKMSFPMLATSAALHHHHHGHHFDGRADF
jgi:hypothetical protein